MEDLKSLIIRSQAGDLDAFGTIVQRLLRIIFNGFITFCLGRCKR